ncbi:MAG: kelch repeat-containing protein [Planctomycetota bacterium]
MTRFRFLLLFLALFAASCGGGGGGNEAPAFGIAGSSPVDGSVDADPGSPVVITFTTPADLATVTAATARLEHLDGTPVLASLVKKNFNPTNVSIEPNQPLAPNTQYRVILSGAIQSEDGGTLGADRQICFITVNPTPTVRPDQLLDLGDRLNVARFLARTVRAADGRFLIFGGYQDETSATDRIEAWDPVRRIFDLLPTRLLTARAEHTVTKLGDGRLLIAGGVQVPGGAPLASTELFDPSGDSIEAGPDLNEARRWHGASPYRANQSAMVTGGFGVSGDPLDTVEFLSGKTWQLLAERLPEPTAQHVQVLFGFDQVYTGSSNIRAKAAYYSGTEFLALQEGDQRYRGVAVQLSANRILTIGGDTRSMTTYDADTHSDWLASDLLHERRGTHSVTLRDNTGFRYLVAGGFNIAFQGVPPLATLEIVDHLPIGPFGFPDAVAYRVANLQLPVPFAGHIGFAQDDGATVLAGGVGDGSGPHSRRVVMVLDSRSTPSPGCLTK